MVSLAAGCGGSDNSGGVSPDTPQEKAVAKTYHDYIDALKRGDGKTACGLLTPAFRRRAGSTVAIGTRSDLKGAVCVKVVDQGTLPQIQQVVPNIGRIVVNGKQATGFDPGEGQIGPQKVYFEKLGGGWKISRTVFYGTGSG